MSSHAPFSAFRPGNPGERVFRLCTTRASLAPGTIVPNFHLYRTWNTGLTKIWRSSLRLNAKFGWLEASYSTLVPSLTRSPG